MHIHIPICEYICIYIFPFVGTHCMFTSIINSPIQSTTPDLISSPYSQDRTQTNTQTIHTATHTHTDTTLTPISTSTHISTPTLPSAFSLTPTPTPTPTPKVTPTSIKCSPNRLKQNIHPLLRVKATHKQKHGHIWIDRKSQRLLRDEIVSAVYV